MDPSFTVPLSVSLSLISSIQLQKTVIHYRFELSPTFSPFSLSREFIDLDLLKVVCPIVVLGGLLQIVILMFLCGITTMLCGAKLSDGVFVGCFLLMSSIVMVVKFLVEKNSNNILHGKVTIGILIFQDCVVGLLFALLPVLGGNSGILQGIASIGKLIAAKSVDTKEVEGVDDAFVLQAAQDCAFLLSLRFY